MMKKTIALFLFCAALTVFLFSSCAAPPQPEPSGTLSAGETSISGTLADISLSICTQPASVTQPPSASEKIRMTYAGDCSVGAINGFQGPRYFPAVYQASRSISYPFDRVKSILRRMI